MADQVTPSVDENSVPEGPEAIYFEFAYTNDTKFVPVPELLGVQFAAPIKPI